MQDLWGQESQLSETWGQTRIVQTISQNTCVHTKMDTWSQLQHIVHTYWNIVRYMICVIVCVWHISCYKIKWSDRLSHSKVCVKNIDLRRGRSAVFADHQGSFATSHWAQTRFTGCQAEWYALSRLGCQGRWLRLPQARFSSGRKLRFVLLIGPKGCLGFDIGHLM